MAPPSVLCCLHIGPFVYWNRIGGETGQSDSHWQSEVQYCQSQLLVHSWQFGHSLGWSLKFLPERVLLELPVPRTGNWQTF
jgi:hypothetical protein